MWWLGGLSALGAAGAAVANTTHHGAAAGAAAANTSLKGPQPRGPNTTLKGAEPPHFERLHNVTSTGQWYMAKNACLNKRAIVVLEGNEQDQLSVPLVHDSRQTRKYRHVNGTLLIFTVYAGFPYTIGNIAHIGSGAFPVFEALEQLRSAYPEEADVDTVLAWQYHWDHTKWKAYDWFRDVLKLMCSRGLGTRLMVQEVLETSGVCARRILTLARTEWWQRRPDFAFKNASLTRAFRERTLQQYGFPKELQAQKPKCTTLVVVRDPPQGWVNSDEVNKHFAVLLELYGWNLRIWHSVENFTTHNVTLREQVLLFVDVALSIMSLGAENANLIFQPPGSAVLVVHKCGDGSYLPRMARDCGFPAFESFPVGCLLRPRFSNWTVNEYSLYAIDFKGDLLPPLVEALVSAHGSCTQ